MAVEIRVVEASSLDEARVLDLLETARRRYVAFGAEDLPALLASGNCLVAAPVGGARYGAGERLWAFLGVSVSASGWAFLRGVAIVNGWQTSDGLNAMLQPLFDRLRRRHVTYLAVYGTAEWLVPALLRADFQRLDWIVTLKRHPRPLPTGPACQAAIRPVAAGDLGDLARLDAAAFGPPYQLASGELIELMVTSGHFAVARSAGSLVGYACADVLGDEGQIIRLAVHPQAQRQGIGRALLNGSLAYCHDHKARYAIVNTQASNVASLKLYEQFGFRRVGSRVPLLVAALA